MREQLQARLATLRHEYETGQTQLREIERKEAYLRETLLRISGAIQVLEELLAAPDKGQDSSPVESDNIVEESH